MLKQADAFRKISLPPMTVTTREELALNVEETLKTKLLACKSDSLASDESADLTDTAQTDIFIRGIGDELQFFEELLALLSLEMSPLKFYQKYVDKEKYVILRMYAARIFSPFGSSYLCEQMFSRNEAQHVTNY